MLHIIRLLGHPLGHSVSPAFQQAALDRASIQARYILEDVPPDQLTPALGRLRDPQALGANVTVPYKEAVLPLLDEVDPRARAVGAVNTIVRRDTRLYGYNTDVEGFARGLFERTGFQLADRNVLLLGAGGASRAVAYAAIEAGAGSLIIANRDVDRASRLLADFKRNASVHQPRMEAITMAPGPLASALQEADLLVNATPVGMAHTASEGTSPLGQVPIPPHLLVYDLVYNPRQTRLLRDAADAGARTLDGLAMLVYQGAAAFTLWTGQEPQVDVMFAAAEAALASMD